MQIDCQKIAREILNSLKKEIKVLNSKKITPCFAIILIGSNPASLSYITQKKLKATYLGIKTNVFHYKENVSAQTITECIKKLNSNEKINGIVLQEPLPETLKTKNLGEHIDIKKDVDGFRQNSLFTSPVALAVENILRQTLKQTKSTLAFNTFLKQNVITVIGKGKTGGKPIIDYFKNKGLKINVIDSKTTSKKEAIEKSSIIICAVGKKDILTADNLTGEKKILINLGLHREKDKKLHGDYDEKKIRNYALYYTTGTGGVGPINVACLLKNVVKSAFNELSDSSL